MELRLNKLCIHNITTKPWELDEAIAKYSIAGIGGISIWRNYLQGKSLSSTRQLLDDSGLRVISLVRGGFFTGIDEKNRSLAISENKIAIEEAAAIGADMLVLVCGATPKQSLAQSRTQIREAIEILLPCAIKKGVKLAVEPLHPMYADSRSAINTLEQANDLVELFDSEFLGVALDVYHTWWDPGLQDQILRCGNNRNLLAYHISDWRNPTRDMLNDRTIMGNGVINIREITEWVVKAGFDGYFEVEIFSNEYWQGNQDEFLDKIVNAYLSI